MCLSLQVTMTFHLDSGDYGPHPCVASGPDVASPFCPVRQHESRDLSSFCHSALGSCNQQHNYPWIDCGNFHLPCKSKRCVFPGKPDLPHRAGAAALRSWSQRNWRQAQRESVLNCITFRCKSTAILQCIEPDKGS